MDVPGGGSTCNLPLPFMRPSSYRQGETEPHTALPSISTILHFNLNFKTSNREENHFFQSRKTRFILSSWNQQEKRSLEGGEDPTSWQSPRSHLPTQPSINTAKDQSPAFGKLLNLFIYFKAFILNGTIGTDLLTYIQLLTFKTHSLWRRKMLLTVLTCRKTPDRASCHSLYH